MTKLRRVRRTREDGQSLVEFALALPMLAIFILTVIQLSLVLITYFSETQMARTNARWLAVRAGSTGDLQFAEHVQQTMLPGLVGATPQLVTAGTAGTDTVYDVGRMRVEFTPCLVPVSPSTVCPHAQRAPGETLHVTMTYNMSNLFFLPTQFRIGSLAVTLPTSLPPYRVSVMVE